MAVLILIVDIFITFNDSVFVFNKISSLLIGSKFARWRDFF